MKTAGIAIGNGKLRIVDLKGSAKKARLVNVLEVELSGAETGEALTERLRESGVGAGRVVVTVEGPGALIRRMTVPIANPRALSQAVAFQAEDLLCGDSLENVVIDHVLFGPSEDGQGSEVLVFAARKRDVAEALSALRDVGLEPAAVTLDGAALFNLASSQGWVPKSGRGAVLSLDGEKARILLSREGRLSTYRTVVLSRQEGPPGDLPDLAARELAKTLAVEGDETAPVAVTVLGGDAPRLAQMVSTRFGVEASAPDLAALFGGDGRPAPAPAPLGAALTALGAGPLSIDLRQGELAPTDALRKVYARGLFAIGAVAALFGVLLVASMRRLDAAQDYLDRLTREEKKLWTSVHPKKPFPRVGFDRYIVNVKEDGKQEAEKDLAHPSFLETLTTASEAFPSDGVFLQAVAFDGQKLVLAGEVSDMDRFDALVSGLEGRFGIRVKPQMERRGRSRNDASRTVFKIEIPRLKENR